MTSIFGSSPPSGGTPSFTQNNELPTPNAPLGGPWNVPGNIPDMNDLLGVDLCHDFSAEADEVDERGIIEEETLIGQLGIGIGHVGHRRGITDIVMID